MVSAPPPSLAYVQPPSPTTRATHRAGPSLMDMEPPKNSRQQRQQAAAATDKVQHAELTQPITKQAETRRRAAEVAHETPDLLAAGESIVESMMAPAAVSRQSAADGFKTKPTGLRPAPAADDRTNVPSRSANRSARTAAIDSASNGSVEKENATAVERQSADRKPPHTAKPASEEPKKADQPRPITVLTTAAASLGPNVAEMVKQLGGVHVLDRKEGAVTHCVVGDWKLTAKVSQPPPRLLCRIHSSSLCHSLGHCVSRLGWFVRSQSVTSSVLGAWMMPPEWLSASAEAGKWLDEKEHGGWRATVNPLAGKRIAFDSSLYPDKKGQAAELMGALIQVSKGCKLVIADLAHPESFDLVVVGSEATAADKSKWPADQVISYDLLMVATLSLSPSTLLASASRSLAITVSDGSLCALSDVCAGEGSILQTLEEQAGPDEGRSGCVACEGQCLVRCFSSVACSNSNSDQEDAGRGAAE